jgi:hypothetical protein
MNDQFSPGTHSHLMLVAVPPPPPWHKAMLNIKDNPMIFHSHIQGEDLIMHVMHDESLQQSI